MSVAPWQEFLLYPLALTIFIVLQDINTPGVEVMFYCNNNIDNILFFVETCTGNYEGNQ
jgi:hypothetical protein